MFFDVALVYDRETRRADLALGDDGDLLIDETPITPILLSVGLDQRADPDDPLPGGRTQFLVQSGIDVRRGSACDALDVSGERIGSRLWLLDRAKQTEAVRLLFLFWLAECMEWARRETGAPAELEADWAAPGVLAYRVMVADQAVSLRGAG